VTLTILTDPTEGTNFHGVIIRDTVAVFVPKTDKHPPPADPAQQVPEQVFVPRPDLPPIDNGAPRDTGLTIDTRPTPQPANGPADHGPVSLMATHTIPPYPAMDVRLGNEGTVLLRLTVGPDGRVVEAHVVRTSGFESLDRAAQAWRSRRVGGPFGGV